MYELLDNLHWSPNHLLSRNKKFNAVISAREAGKSTGVWSYIYDNKFVKKHETAIVIRRLISDITDTYIGDIEEVINKFQPPDRKIKLIFKKGGAQNGVVDVKVCDAEGLNEPVPFFRVIGLSNPKGRIKSLMYPNLGTLFFDEFIIDTRGGEKYLRNEVFRFQELYNTFKREAKPDHVCIFAANPYSLYNPYFSWWGVDTSKLYEGSFQTGSNWAVECYELKPELKAKILADNPLYDENQDNPYKRYAFDGRAINDEQIRVWSRLPQNFELKYVFYIDHKKLSVYRNTQLDEKNWYWIGIDNDYMSIRRDIITFDFNTLVEGTMLLCNEDKKAFRSLKNAFRLRKILFKSIEESYLFEQIYVKI